MAQVPLGQKFHTVPSNVQTVERGSALANSQREIYTMPDIIDTAGSANPSVINLKVTNGTVVTGTTAATISQSILIPANTFTSEGGALEFMARYQKTGTAGNQSCSVWLGTSESFTGSNLIASFTISNSSTFVQGLRTARISAGSLTIYPANTTGITDYVTSTQSQTSVAFDHTIDNYLLFVIQLINAADSSVVEMARATKYE
jgi:hypothetical protein